MKIKITSDSTSDLTEEIRQKYDISVAPTTVIFKEKEYLDGVDITPDTLFEMTAKEKELPRTSATNPSEYKEFFEGILKDYDAIIHFSLSSKMSSMFQNANIAASNFEGKVFVVDSQTLSTGIGLQMLYACDLAKKGVAPEDIKNKVLERQPFATASFVLDTLKFMHKGGRCSTIALLGANLLKIKPIIAVENGAMGVVSKPRGKFDEVVMHYVDFILNRYSNQDKTRCFLTYSTLDDNLVQKIKERIKPIFKEILITRAGCTVASHCGPNTVGILFYNDGNKQ